MAALEAAAYSVSLFSSSPKSPLSSLSTTTSSSRLRLFVSTPTPTLSLKFPFSPLLPLPKKFQTCCSAVEEITVQETTKPKPSGKPDIRRKLFVLNLPWSYSVADIKTLFGECGTVTDVEIIKSLDGKNRGYAFVTMDTGEEARAAVEKFDSYDVLGRIIKVEFSRRFKKPSPPPPPASPPQETRYKLYVSNLAWKVRSTQLREFFASFNPVSARVVFDNPTGRSAGYGFVTFATNEEAEAAISALNGKELFDRPIILRFSQRSTDGSGDGVGSISSTDGSGDEVGSTLKEEPVGSQTDGSEDEVGSVGSTSEEVPVVS